MVSTWWCTSGHPNPVLRNGVGCQSWCAQRYRNSLRGGSIFGVEWGHQHSGGTAGAAPARRQFGAPGRGGAPSNSRRPLNHKAENVDFRSRSYVPLGTARADAGLCRSSLAKGTYLGDRDRGSTRPPLHGHLCLAVLGPWRGDSACSNLYSLPVFPRRFGHQSPDLPLPNGLSVRVGGQRRASALHDGAAHEPAVGAPSVA